jgi:hypothetical protein
MSAKALPDFGVDAFQGLEDGNWGELAFWRRGLLAFLALVFLAPISEKTGQRERGQEIETQTAGGSNHSHSLEHCSCR